MGKPFQFGLTGMFAFGVKRRTPGIARETLKALPVPAGDADVSRNAESAGGVRDRNRRRQTGNAVPDPR